ncbi:MAG: ribonuclease E/G [Alphaproteobacteria bacterium]|nr:MAG: ribonuclease E/G [Alphaproteobacteria bacterium]
MLIDASQTEETRVAVVRNGQLQDFDVESLVRRQIKSNIYLAKVTRVEPSLQAAFVNYGGNRHGFLPFSEIHPDYYRIPVADRERLMAEQVELEREAAEEAARLAEEEDKKAIEEEKEATAEKPEGADDNTVEEIEDEKTVTEAGVDAKPSDDDAAADDADDSDGSTDETKSEDDTADKDAQPDADSDADNGNKKNNGRGGRGGRGRYRRGGRGGKKYSSSRNSDDRVNDDDDVTAVEPFWKRIRRAYKIQEVIKRGQIMLIQVNKDERGNKGAAVTSYITLPGRYCVLMPNTPQSGGVSRKIANYKDRKRMREILKDLEVPQGMSVILRTAGTSRTKDEIKRDLDYLMRLWNNIRELTLKSSAPALINEEGSLIRRSIRDIYNKDIDEVIVSGARGYQSARDMMNMLMPTHVNKVVEYKNDTPLFIKERIETQIEDMHSQEVHLKSGGYLVINPTEALVSVDVNSGRSTKERNIEETALRTNLEAAEELARQLRLRDLGGLVVIDFIDMEKRSYNGKVERAMRDALSGDRARIQVGRISSFGLMEMSRQRLQPSLTETHFETCPHCQGMGIVKTVDTLALAILRAIEESGIAKRNSNLVVTMENEVALYLLNNRRQSLNDLEGRYNLSIVIEIGKVEDEARFTLKSKVKPAVQSDDDNDSDMNAPKVDHNKQQDRKPNNNNRHRNNNKKKDDAVKTEDGANNKKVEATVETPVAEDKPKRGRRKKVEPQKVEIVDVAEDKPKKEKAKPKAATQKPEPKDDDGAAPSPTNDNADENVAAKDAETVNEKPKAKKKGWWNKIIES